MRARACSQARWKGGALPLVLMRKPLRAAVGERGGAVAAVPARGFDEYKVSLSQIREYDEREAWVWFGLLVLRNFGALTPAYRLLPLAAVAAGLLSYAAIASLASALS